MENLIDMNDMNPEAELTAYLFDEMEPGARAGFEARLAASAELRGELESLRRTLALLEERFKAAPEPALSIEARQRLAESAAAVEIIPMAAEVARPTVRSRRQLRNRVLFGLSSLAAAGMAIVLWAGNGEKAERKHLMTLELAQFPTGQPNAPLDGGGVYRPGATSGRVGAGMRMREEVAEPEAQGGRNKENFGFKRARAKPELEGREVASVPKPVRVPTHGGVNEKKSDLGAAAGAKVESSLDTSSTGGQLTPRQLAEVEARLKSREGETKAGEKSSPSSFEVRMGQLRDQGATEIVASLSAENEKARGVRSPEEDRKLSKLASTLRDADIMHREKKYDEAINLAKQALKLDPNNNYAAQRIHQWEMIKSRSDEPGVITPNQPVSAPSAAPSEPAKSAAVKQKVTAPDWAPKTKADGKAKEKDRGLDDLGEVIVGDLEGIGQNWFNSADAIDLDAIVTDDPPRKQLNGLAVADANVPQQVVQVVVPATPAPTPADMYFQDHGVNPFVDAKSDALSTFAIDVDTASYTVVRNYLNRGMIPPPEAVRVEEVVNYFPESYAPPTEAPFAIHGTMIPSPFGKGFQLLRVGIKGRVPDPAARKPVVLTFVIDTSGSMAAENRLGLVKRTLTNLVSKLRPEDQVGIAIYESTAREVLAHTPVKESGKILAAIERLVNGGSTNANEGLEVGYAMARRAFRKEAVNRVILCTDGVANNGITNPDLMLSNVARNAGENIYLTAIGCGMGNMNDALIETLADKGNGQYAYLDSDEEARRFVDLHLAGGMEVIAQDAKIQVTFNPATVKQYRLIGFENRDVADADFRNDAVDAGEIMAGHAVTALYELELANPGANAAEAQDIDRSIATARIRFKQPAKGMEVIELAERFVPEKIGTTFEKADDHMKVVTLAAEYGEILRNSYWARDGRMEKVAALFDEAFPGNPPNAETAELRGLIGIAGPLTANRPAAAMPSGPKKGTVPGPNASNGGGRD